MAIDMHAHWMPRELHDALHERGKAPLPKRFDAVGERLAEMDKYGYSRAVLSISLGGGVESRPIEEAFPLCQAFNDATAAACVDHPDRFYGFAALPTADMEVMIEELERTAIMPGMIGALLPGDGFLSLHRAEKFRPLFRAANERGAVFLVHYARMADDPEGRMKELTDNSTPRRGTLDMQARLSENMVTFCMTDFLADYPNVTVISHNLGGNIPFEVERMDHRTLVDRPEDELPSQRFREAPIMVDCNSFGSRGIELGVAVYGADKVVCGSDGTSFGMDWTNKAVAEARISETEKQLILEGNAEALLARGRHAASGARS